MHASGKTKVSKLDVRVIVITLSKRRQELVIERHKLEYTSYRTCTTYHKEQILWLHVTVSNVSRVTVGHGLEHLRGQVSGISLTVGLLFTNSIKEITTAHEFHDNKVAVLLVKKVNQGNNVGMLQRREDGNLIVDGSIVRGRQVLPQHTLDGNLLASSTMSTTTDCSK